MFIPFNLFSNQPPPGSSWCLLLKMFIPRMLQLKSKIIPWPARHSLIHDTFQYLLPPSSWSLGFSISHLAILPPHPLSSSYHTPNSGTLQLLFLCMESYCHRYSYGSLPYFIQVSPEISLCEKSLLWLPSLYWPIFITFYFFILLWFSSPPDITLYILIFFIAYVSNYNENSIRKFSVYFTHWYIPSD